MSNIYNLFKFLEKKKGTETPLKFKLIYAPEEVTDEDLNVEGDLDLEDSPITTLPDNLKVGGSLDLSGSPITSLPDNLKVGDFLDLQDTPITSLPDGLKVGSTLYLDNTSLAEKYTKEEIRKMIEDKGGYLKGWIYA